MGARETTGKAEDFQTVRAINAVAQPLAPFVQAPNDRCLEENRRARRGRAVRDSGALAGRAHFDYKPAGAARAITKCL